MKESKLILTLLKDNEFVTEKDEKNVISIEGKRYLIRAEEVHYNIEDLQNVIKLIEHSPRIPTKIEIKYNSK